MERSQLGVPVAYRPPGSDVERLLSRLMADALDLDVVGVDDDFFQLGGDSLAAENLFMAIEAATCRRLPVSILFDHPSVALLSKALASGAVAPDAAVVRIHGRGSKSALFLVPGIGGDVIGMEPLARHLDRDLPVYCCKFPGLDPVKRPLESIEDIATDFIPEIQRLQPSGPYHLLGACFGGLAALEMAHRLHNEGAEIGLLCLVDTPLPGTRSRPETLRVGIGVQFAVDRLRIFVREFVRRRGGRMAYVRHKSLRVASAIMQGGLPPETRAEVAKKRVVAANHVASRRYTPRPYGGSAIYVRSRDREDESSRARRASWKNYFPVDFADHAISCHDSGDLFANHADELAEIVSDAMHQLQAIQR